MRKKLIAIALVLTFFGCQNSQKVETGEVESAQTDEATAADSAIETKIIKTADMSFRVKDVQRTKEALGKQIREASGQLVSFEIVSTVNSTEKIRQSLDSLKETTSYRTVGSLTAKVPADRLDDFTNSVARLAVFVDRQSLSMDDQSLNYLSNKLKTQNNKKATNKIDNLTEKKSTDVKSSLYISDNSIERKVENLQIDNSVRLSTITLSFYQDNTVKSMVVGNDQLSDYRPSFFKRLWLNMVDGWGIFKEFILILANIWVFLLIAVGLIVGIRYLNTKRRYAKLP